MADLVYTAITSLDGYVNDADGGFAWAEPDADVHAFVNDLERPVGTQLLGRRTYEDMQYWETAPLDGVSDVEADFTRLWRAADKVVFSRTLDEVTADRTTLVRELDPGDLAARKAAADRPLSIGGPTLAAHAFAAGLVDEVRLFLNPVVVGGGTPALPDGLRLDLSLVDEHRFDNGVVFLRYSA